MCNTCLLSCRCTQTISQHRCYRLHISQSECIQLCQTKLDALFYGLRRARSLGNMANVFNLTSALIVLLANIIHIVGFSSNNWSVSKVYGGHSLRFGLWKACFNAYCFKTSTVLHEGVLILIYFIGILLSFLLQ